MTKLLTTIGIALFAILCFYWLLDKDLFVGESPTPVRQLSDDSHRPIGSGNAERRSETWADNSRFQSLVQKYNKLVAEEADVIESILKEELPQPKNARQLDALSVIFLRFSEIDPEKALYYALHNGAVVDNVWTRMWIDSIFQAWAMSDLESAIAAATLLPEYLKPNAAAAILSARTDIPGLQGRLSKALGVKESFALASAPGMSLFDREPSAYWDEAFRMRAGPDEIRLLATRWASSDPAGATAAVFELGDERMWTLRNGLGAEMLRHWVREDQTAALAWVRSLSDSELRRHALLTVFREYAEISSRDALTAALDLPDLSQRSGAVSAVISHIARSDHRAARHLYESIADPTLKIQSASSIALQMAMENPEEAFEWAADLSVDESRCALPSIIGIRAEHDIAKATEWIELVTDPSARRQSIRFVASQWAERDPYAALEWAQRDSVERFSGAAVERIFRVWAVEDQKEALKSLDTISDSALVDVAATTLLNNCQADTCDQLYGRISSYSAQIEAAQRLASRWSAWDDERAEFYRRRIETLRAESRECD